MGDAADANPPSSAPGDPPPSAGERPAGDTGDSAALLRANEELRAKVAALEEQLAAASAAAARSGPAGSCKRTVSPPATAAASTVGVEAGGEPPAGIDEEAEAEFKRLENKFFSLAEDSVGPLSGMYDPSDPKYCGAALPAKELKEIQREQAKAKIRGLLAQLKRRKEKIQMALKSDFSQEIRAGSTLASADITDKVELLKNIVSTKEQTLLEYVTKMEEGKNADIYEYQQQLEKAKVDVSSCIESVTESMDIGRVEFMERHGEFVNQLSQCLEHNRKFSEIPTGFKNLSFQSSLLQNAWTKDVLSNLDKLDPSTWTTSKINTGLVVPLSVQQKKKRMESLQLLILDLNRTKRELAAESKYMEAALLLLKTKQYQSNIEALSTSVKSQEDIAAGKTKPAILPSIIVPIEKTDNQAVPVEDDENAAVTRFHLEFLSKELDVRFADAPKAPTVVPKQPVVPPQEKIIASKPASVEEEHYNRLRKEEEEQAHKQEQPKKGGIFSWFG